MEYSCSGLILQQYSKYSSIRNCTRAKLLNSGSLLQRKHCERHALELSFHFTCSPWANLIRCCRQEGEITPQAGIRGEIKCNSSENSNLDWESRATEIKRPRSGRVLLLTSVKSEFCPVQCSVIQARIYEQPARWYPCSNKLYLIR